MELCSLKTRLGIFDIVHNLQYDTGLSFKVNVALFTHIGFCCFIAIRKTSNNTVF